MWQLRSWRPSPSTETNASARFTFPARSDFTSVPCSSIPASTLSRSSYSCRARRFWITGVSAMLLLLVVVFVRQLDERDGGHVAEGSVVEQLLHPVLQSSVRVRREVHAADAGVGAGRALGVELERGVAQALGLVRLDGADGRGEERPHERARGHLE